MPYIKTEKRPAIDTIVDQLTPETPGDLNYSITRLVHHYCEE